MSLNKTQQGCKSQRGKLADMPLNALQIPTAIHSSVNAGKPEFWFFCSFKDFQSVMPQNSMLWILVVLWVIEMFEGPAPSC